MVNYEEAKFLKKAIKELKFGRDLVILMHKKRHIKQLRSELDLIVFSKGEFPSMKLFVCMLPFLTAHFYALTAGYKVSSSGDERELRIIYTKS